MMEPSMRDSERNGLFTRSPLFRSIRDIICEAEPIIPFDGNPGKVAGKEVVTYLSAFNCVAQLSGRIIRTVLGSDTRADSNEKCDISNGAQF